MSVVDDLIRLANAVGEPHRELAILGEGNVSARIDDERMLVKASGASLAATGADDLVEVRLAPILELLHDPNASDDRVAEVLMGARVDPTAKRPSIEGLLHAVVMSLGAQAACHTHPVAVNAIICSDRAEVLLDGPLFPDQIVVLGPEQLMVPYLDPGLGLGLAMHAALTEFRDRTGALPKLTYLRNHGIFAIGQSPAECLRITEMAVKVARIMHGVLAIGAPQHLPAAVVDRIETRPDEHLRRRVLDGRAG
ncbi:class II aldolase/adducin family protein [Agrococcus sp. SGAir0287]|uniref:class II aldolase/adducin family protein n=1 Tax=Agrococcus sp. SGAir0287 TaxID=2070347 RepID=UPI0010CD5D21|nr:class II aldolase/adducin family protein [Agrococcus sp. SGAir0287]QCR18360.1 aldolase [Agrococcus sp. SGAir0287]